MFKDKEYFRSLFTLALPIILENFFFSSLNLLSGVMVGQLGETVVAAVGLANQVFFVLMLTIFGITSGCAIFSAQLWGKRDVNKIHRVLGISLAMSLTAGSFFFLVSVSAPQAIIGIYSRDPEVIRIGGQFLRLITPSFILIAIAYSYGITLRSTGDVRTPLIASSVALGLTALLSYLLIFGRAGMPRLGANGAAVAIVIGRVVDVVLLLMLTYGRRTPVAANLRDMFSFDFPFFRRVISRALPVAFNELLWALGTSAYSIIYARMSTEAIAAVNIVVVIEEVGFVFFIGISDATAILLGNKIGEGRKDTAARYGRYSLTLAALGGACMGTLVFAASGLIINLYQVSDTVRFFAHSLLAVFAGTMWIRVLDMTFIVGVFRSGGDSRFAFLLDSGSIWFIGVPLAFFGAFILGFPVYLVYLLVAGEEFLKMLVCILRFRSNKWINDLTRPEVIPV